MNKSIKVWNYPIWIERKIENPDRDKFFPITVRISSNIEIFSREVFRYNDK